MTFRVYDSIKGISEQWDQLIPSAHHLQSAYLKAVEESGIDGARFYYLFFENEMHECIGLAYFQSLNFNEQNYRFPALKYPLLQWVEKKLMSRGFRILVCGNLLNVNSPGVMILDSKTSLREIFDCIERFTNSLQITPHAVLIKDCPEEPDLSFFNRFHYKPWHPDSTMKLVFPDAITTTDGYINALRHRYAQRYRKMRRMLPPIKRRELTTSEIQAHSITLHQLYMNVVTKQAIRLIVVGESYWSRMTEALGDRFRVYGYFDEGQLVSFSSNVIHEKHWELHYIGMDYDRSVKHGIYFNLLYDAVSDCLESGRRELELGRTARSTKESLGATPTNFKNYVKIKNVIAGTMTSIMRVAFERLNPATSDSFRPFKS